MTYPAPHKPHTKKTKRKIALACTGKRHDLPAKAKISEYARERPRRKDGRYVRHE